MDVDTGNFHVFFPKGCYRKELTPRRYEIFIALDNAIKSEGFDMALFEKVKQAFLDSNTEEAFLRLNKLVTPLFLQMVDQGFSREELQNYKEFI